MPHRPCSKCGRTTTGKYCSRCKDGHRPAWSSLYKTERWRRLSKAWRIEYPLCVICEAEGRTTLATVCDHVEPHRGDLDGFWNGPFQSLCHHHHSVKTRQEQQGRLVGGG